MRFLFHSFPRKPRFDEEPYNNAQRGLKILESMAAHGLVLVPEGQTWTENTAPPQTVEIEQKRMCFTDLAPSELLKHANFFGGCALQYEHTVLINAGGMPAIYIPERFVNVIGAEDIGSSVVGRLAEIEAILENLHSLEHNTPQSADGNLLPLLQQVRGEVKTDFGDLITGLLALSSFFYPLDSWRYTHPVGYYYQREWKLTNWAKIGGKKLAEKLNDNEIQELLSVDQPFFSKSYLAGNSITRAHGSEIIRQTHGEHPLAWAKAVIVPDNYVADAQHILSNHKINVPVIGLTAFATSAEKPDAVMSLAEKELEAEPQVKQLIDVMPKITQQLEHSHQTELRWVIVRWRNTIPSEVTLHDMKLVPFTKIDGKVVPNEFSSIIDAARQCNRSCTLLYGATQDRHPGVWMWREEGAELYQTVVPAYALGLGR